MTKKRKYNTKYIRLTDTGGYALTADGEAKVFEHASRGGGIVELSKLFGVSHSLLSRWKDENDGSYNSDFAGAYEAGEYEFTDVLRESQLELSKVNASMAIHMGKHYLGQDDKPQEHHHLHQVIGTLPNYDSSAEDWARQFAPDPVLEAQKRLEMEVEEAEVVEVQQDETG